MKKTLIAVGCTAVLAFFGGYRYAAALYEEDIADLRADYAARAQNLEVKYREKEKEQYKSLLAAWEERDKALSRIDDLASDFERVRREADAARSRLSSAAGSSCESERKQLARCASLVERGSELVRRGVELSERTAIDKDAVVRIVE